MGFIDKALEKAKAEKQKSQGAGAAGTTAPPPKVAPAMPPPPPTGAETAPEAITYSATRTMPVSQEELRRRRIITVIDDNLVREEYKILRTQILQRTREQQKNTLMITGPSPNEGKTLTAINLAISLSHEVDKTVLLVDADLRFSLHPLLFRHPVQSRPGGLPVRQRRPLRPAGAPPGLRQAGHPARRQGGGGGRGTHQLPHDGQPGAGTQTFLPGPLRHLRSPPCPVLYRPPGVRPLCRRHYPGGGNGQDPQGRHPKDRRLVQGLPRPGNYPQ